MQEHDEIALLQAWQHGDREAGDQLMRTYYGSILGFFHLRAPSVAEDLTQRTFLACTEARARVRGASVRGFLFGVARKILLKHHDSKTRDAELAQDAPRPLSILSPTGVLRQRQEHWLLLRALERLPNETQMIIALHYVQGLSNREIAEALGCPTSTVTSRLFRAREALRDQVETTRAPVAVRRSLLEHLEDWARSLGPLVNRSG